MKDSMTANYLNYRIDTMIIPVRQDNNKFVIISSGFPKLKIEAETAEKAREQLKDLMKKELENEGIEKIDDFLNTFNKP
jgi:hydrogenase maturation factor